jgi:amino acid adenylation domain-containing protein
MSFLLSHYLSDSLARYPARPAVKTREGVMTYAELDRESDKLARALAAARIGTGSRVGLCMPKCQRAIASMLGSLKAGAAYVPVDPAAPARRGGFILQDCGVRALVTSMKRFEDYREVLPSLPSLELIILVDGDAAAVSVPGVRVLGWDDLPTSGPLSSSRPAIETDPAYLLYTSGSTGNPKGVILSHRHARLFVDWCVETFGVTASDRVSNHAPLHFDLSVFDIYGALSTGACVHIVPDDLAPFPIELARWIEAEQISVWYSVPSALVRLLLHGKLERFSYQHLRTILFAGEVFPMKYLREVMERLSHVAFYNLYGPTETNVCTYYALPPRLPESATEIPIGAACANTDVFAVDDDGKEVQVGGTGELLVRGPAVMLGYWGLAERTRQSLIANPLQPAYYEPAYRTGDIVRLAEDGMYYFSGRRDHMVKSRGYRIELGEIEQALLQHDAVREAAIIAIADEEVGARLHAAVAPVEGKTVNARELQTYCAGRLPRYMVPETFLVRRELPKTSPGKIDRVSLRDELVNSSVETTVL